ncbi:hypothetical protein INR49_013136 [Caranx melampygus]|nr:hypothetical protein INR49_013136 [Caranx melampygus]
MDDFSSISLLSLAMLVGCYVAGTIPLAVNFSEERLKLITVLGAGLLCGTALAVIIPEGVHALYEEILEGRISKSAVLPAMNEQNLFVLQHILEKHSFSQFLSGDARTNKCGHHSHGQVGVAEVSDTKVEADVALGASGKHEHSHEQLHACIGVSLVLGFVFMLLVDQIGSSHVHNTEDPESARVSSSKITTTLGLVVHAAADGVALGAAASTSQTSVQLIVFVAIMLHKAPAAFGLVSFLMHAGLERNRIRKHLLSSKEALSDVNATGVAMLFSAGTFLYVATVHVLPEVGGGGHSHAPAGGNGGKGLSKVEVGALVLGCLIPLVLSVGHHH